MGWFGFHFNVFRFQVNLATQILLPCCSECSKYSAHFSFSLPPQCYRVHTLILSCYMLSNTVDLFHYGIIIRIKACNAINFLLYLWIWNLQSHFIPCSLRFFHLFEQSQEKTHLSKDLPFKNLNINESGVRLCLCGRCVCVCTCMACVHI